MTAQAVRERQAAQFCRLCCRPTQLEWPMIICINKVRRILKTYYMLRINLPYAVRL